MTDDVYRRRQHTRPLFLSSLEDQGSARRLRRVEKGKRPDEAWLQRLVHRYPQILPVHEIEPGFTDIVPVCRELPTPSGPADNVFVTPRGDVVLVECKLWHNPEARRKVVAQIIDYAQSMSTWTYDDLDRAVKKGIDADDQPVSRSLWELVSERDERSEAEFVDAVARNLRLGRMLLLVVGDGIRESAASLGDYLQAHAGFHFTLGMVELPIYEIAGQGYVVTPRLIVRTVNIERGIVRLTEGVAVEPRPIPKSTTISEDRLREEIAASDPQLIELLDKLEATLPTEDASLSLERAQRSMQLKWQDADGQQYNLGGFTAHGDFQTAAVCWAPSGVLGRVDLAHEYLRSVARIIGGEVRETRTSDNWYVVTRGTKLPRAVDLLRNMDAWLAAVRDYVAKLREATLDTDTAD